MRSQRQRKYQFARHTLAGEAAQPSICLRRVEAGTPALVRENAPGPHLTLSGTAAAPPEASITPFTATAPPRIRFAHWNRVGNRR